MYKGMAVGIMPTFNQAGVYPPESMIFGEISNIIQSIDTDVIGETGGIRSAMGLTGWECGEYAGQIVDLGTDNGRMGDSLQEKVNSVNEYGMLIDDVLANGGFFIGDVVITNGSDVSGSGGITRYGHAAVVIGVDEMGNPILQEANRKGDGKITTGRVLPKDHAGIVGILGRGVNAVGEVGIKQKYLDVAREEAGNNILQFAVNAENDWSDTKLTLQQVEDIQSKYGINVPYGTTNGQLKGMTLYPDKTDTISVLNNTLTLIDEITNSKGLSGSVGAYGVGRFDLLNRAERQNFAASVEQLVQKETLNTLINLKSQGGTLGALSNEERIMLESAATKIGTWAQTGWFSGKKTGKFEISEELFLREIENIRNVVQSSIDRQNSISGKNEKELQSIFDKYEPVVKDNDWLNEK
jgi:hypothetical protein